MTISNTMRQSMQQTAEPLPWIWLVEAELDRTATELVKTRLASYPKDIVFRGKKYAGASFAVGTIERDSEGSLPEVSIVFSNANREAARFVNLGGGLAGRPATVMLTHWRELLTGITVIENDYELGVVTITDETVTVPLQDPQLLNEVWPRDRFSRDHCSYSRFGDLDTCRYLGPTYKTCGRTMADCIKRGDDELADGRPRLHPERIDAYPGLTQRRR